MAHSGPVKLESRGAGARRLCLLSSQGDSSAQPSLGTAKLREGELKALLLPLQLPVAFRLSFHDNFPGDVGPFIFSCIGGGDLFDPREPRFPGLPHGTDAALQDGCRN